MYNIEGEGLEIGPSFRPIAPKKLGFNVKTMDHLDRKGLIEKYKGDSNVGELIKNIEEVDYVWSGQSYIDLIGSDKKFDYIISSHLIEHIPDLIQHLKGCSDLLKSDGVYTLVVPDKRYTFDYFRQLTTVKDCILTYNLKNHSVASVTEYFLNAVQQDDEISWSKQELLRDFSFLYGIDSAYSYFNSRHNSDDYFDIHESVFTPSSFELIIADLKILGLTDLEVISLSPAELIGEFYVTLKKSNNSRHITNNERILLVKKVMSECVEPLECDLINKYFEILNYNFMPKSIEKADYFVDEFDISNKQKTFLLRGWIKLSDEFNMSDVFVKIGKFCYKIHTQSRLDVAKAFGLNNTNLGFYAKLPLEMIKFNGGGEITVIASDKKQNCVYCDLNKKFVI